MAELWLVSDHNDVFVVSEESCVKCFEQAKNTTVLKRMKGDITSIDLKTLKECGVQSVRCPCKKTCGTLKK
jgi:hypothetical protein